MLKQKVETLWVNGNCGSKAVKGDKVTFAVTGKITPADKLYKIVQGALHE